MVHVLIEVRPGDRHFSQISETHPTQRVPLRLLTVHTPRCILSLGMWDTPPTWATTATHPRTHTQDSHLPKGRETRPTSPRPKRITPGITWPGLAGSPQPRRPGARTDAAPIRPSFCRPACHPNRVPSSQVLPGTEWRVSQLDCALTTLGNDRDKATTASWRARWYLAVGSPQVMTVDLPAMGSGGLGSVIVLLGTGH